MNKFDLNNKNAIVTGGAQGFGLDIAKRFLQSGAKVIIWDSDEKELKKASKLINDQNLSCDVVDVSDSKSVDDTVNKITSKTKIDILINNAGITRDNLTLRMKEEEWNSVINLNLSTTFFLTKEILRFMVKNRFGRIINISSVVGSSGNIGQANYAASKAGLEGMTKSIALEVANRGITANCIAPGFIKTAMTSDILEKNEEKIINNIPIKRIGVPDDISSLTKFLASDKASYITGQTFHVNGGMLM